MIPASRMDGWRAHHPPPWLDQNDDDWQAHLQAFTSEDIAMFEESWLLSRSYDDGPGCGVLAVWFMLAVMVALTVIAVAS